MKVIHTHATCELHGECELAAPEVFEIRDGWDYVTVLNPVLDTPDYTVPNPANIFGTTSRRQHAIAQHVPS